MILNPESRGNFRHYTRSTKFAVSCVRMGRQSGKVKCTLFGLWLWPDASTFPLHSLLVSTLRCKSPCCFRPLWHMQESHHTRHLYIGMHKLCSLAPRIIVRVSLLSRWRQDARRWKTFITGKTCTAACDSESFKTNCMPDDVFYPCDRWKRFVPGKNTFSLFSRVDLSRGRISPSTEWQQQDWFGCLFAFVAA